MNAPTLSRAALGIQDVQRALPSDSTLISFVRYQRTIATLVGGRPLLHLVPSYIAFLISPSSDPRDPAWASSPYRQDRRELAAGSLGTFASGRCFDALRRTSLPSRRAHRATASLGSDLDASRRRVSRLHRARRRAERRQLQRASGRRARIPGRARASHPSAVHGARPGGRRQVRFGPWAACRGRSGLRRGSRHRPKVLRREVWIVRVRRLCISTACQRLAPRCTTSRRSGPPRPTQVAPIVAA